VATAPIILALDTSSPRAVAGVVEGTSVLSAALVAAPTAPSEGVLPMIRRCLERAAVDIGEVTAVAVGRGPGSFTGTRIALATAKGIALGADTPLVGVNSLAAAALDTGYTDGPVVVALDARRSEILLAAHAVSGAGARGGVEPVREILSARLAGAARAGEVLRAVGPPERCFVTGDAASLLPERWQRPAGTRPPSEGLIRSPLSLARLALARLERGGADDPDALEPLYSRPPPVHRRRPPLD
jgi:tRNA threonylcarbamoyladenosine biosynthesis protein TsaB